MCSEKQRGDLVGWTIVYPVRVQVPPYETDGRTEVSTYFQRMVERGGQRTSENGWSWTLRAISRPTEPSKSERLGGPQDTSKGSVAGGELLGILGLLEFALLTSRIPNINRNHPPTPSGQVTLCKKNKQKPVKRGLLGFRETLMSHKASGPADIHRTHIHPLIRRLSMNSGGSSGQAISKLITIS